MLEEQIKASSTAVENLRSENKRAVDARVSKDQELKDLAKKLEEETHNRRNLFINERKTFEEMRIEEHKLDKLKKDLAAEIRERDIQELIKEQPTYEQELERVLSDYIQTMDTGLTFEKKNDAKDILEKIKVNESKGGFSEAAVAAREARGLYNQAMRKLCENHYDKNPLNKTLRIEILKRYIKSNSVRGLFV